MRITRPLGALAGFALVLSSAPAAQAQDYATVDDFWTSTSEVSTATVYAPSDKAVRGAGLSQPGEPVSGAFLEMVCAGQWNSSITYDARSADASATLYQATPGCTPDFGAGDARGRWTFKVSGRTFTTRYEDCRGTAEGESTPPVSECPAADAIYSTFGTLPAADGKKRTYVHLDSLGLTRGQIRSLVRSMKPVD